MDNNLSAQLVFDTNVLVDALISRGSYYQYTVDLLEKVKNNKIEGWVASHTLPTLYYLVENTLQSELHDRREAKKITVALVHEIMTFLKILPQCGENISTAFLKFDYDYEDYLIADLAKSYLPNPIIVSRDKTFEGLDLNVEHPADISEQLIKSIGSNKIDFANLQYQQRQILPAIEKNVTKILTNCNFIMGDEVRQLESELQAFTNAKHAITCSSGTDALLLAMMAMDIQPDDEIITTPFTFIATAETIALMKAVPVFVDIEEDTLNIDATKIEAAITEKTKAIMPVSLYGQPADMDEINEIAKNHNLKVIIDGAQSFGATYKQQQEVHHCDIYTTSFFPAKPLGCYGDGGAVFTNNDEYAEKMKMMRVHGQNKRYHHKYIGMGGRMDTLQAAIVLAKLPNYAKEIEMRQEVAEQYNKNLISHGNTRKTRTDQKIRSLIIKNNRTSVWAQYTIRTTSRDELQEQLKQQGIPTAVHYPMPLHKQECFQYLNQKISLPVAEKVAKEVMSLPMNPYITNTEQETIIHALYN